MFNLTFNTAAPSVIVVLFYITLIFVVAVAYKKFLLGKNKIIFVILHSFATFLLLCAIFQPEISISTKIRTKKPILVMIDNSSSMKARDRSGISKIDKAREFLIKNRYLKKYKPVYYSFGQELIPLNEKEIETLKADASATKIGLSISEAIKKHSGNCSGIIVISDGYENQFISWEEMKNNMVLPVYALGTGETSARDIGISSVITNSPVYEGETVKISPVISQTGFDGEKIAISLKESEKLVSGKTIELSSGFNRIDFEMPSLPPGDYLYKVAVQQGIGETNVENNSLTFLVRVVSPKIQILYIEGNLRWEYKFFKRFLESDIKFDPVCLVRVGENTFQQAGGRSIEIPSNILGNAKFLQNFHIIIFGDVDFSSFSERDLENLKNFIYKDGGSVLFMGGENFLKGLNRQHAEDFLPVILTGNESSFIYGPLKPIAGNGAKNLPIFEDFQLLPAVDRINVIGNVKPNCAVLFESPEFKNIPIITTTTAPGGKCVIVATDSTWKWYYGAQQSEKIAYEKFWGKMIRFLCAPENYLGIGNTVPEITLDKHIYAKGEKVSIRFLPGTQIKSFSSYVVCPDRTRVELLVTDNIASFTPEKEGVYIVCVEAEKKVNKKEFVVTKAGSEILTPGKDTIFLKKLAEVSQGAYFDIENADGLKKVLSVRKTIVRKTLAISDETEKYLIPAIFGVL
ncbi:MAG: hypothetical protein NC830_07335, partial [Candidatus Omnitrophica bacterium]|nr:hypothetical protein [Candidatus Omnitrophota bacterium]